MADTIITYETLYEILRKEKERNELQKLPENFLQQSTKYIEEKNLILNSQKSKDTQFESEIQKTERQLINIKRLITELYERRERKITEAALLTSRSLKPQTKITDSMLPEEKELYSNILSTLTNKRDSTLNSLIKGQLSQKTEVLKTKNHENMLIRFIHPVPKFIGLNNKIYGPFDKEDITFIHTKIANLLIDKKRAEEIKT